MEVVEMDESTHSIHEPTVNGEISLADTIRNMSKVDSATLTIITSSCGFRNVVDLQEASLITLGSINMIEGWWLSSNPDCTNNGESTVLWHARSATIEDAQFKLTKTLGLN